MDDSKFLILGASGQLGITLQAKYPNARALNHKDLDVTDPRAVQNFDWGNITTILNAAAYTDVDGAETPEGRITTWKTNATAVSHLVDAAREHNLTLVHISTDYVFDGTQSPHSEEEPLSPLSIYGASKAAGDVAASSIPKHYILRTSWLVGEGKNFVRTMLSVGKKGVSPTVVSDQIGRLTFTTELIDALDSLLSKNAEYGTYNVSNSGEPASWADITRVIFGLSGFNLEVTNTTTEEYYKGKVGIAPRPLNSILDLSKLENLGISTKDWRESLTDYVKKELEQ